MFIARVVWLLLGGLLGLLAGPSALAQPAATPGPSTAVAPGPPTAVAPGPPALAPHRYSLDGGTLKITAPDGTSLTQPLPCPATLLLEAQGMLVLGCRGTSVAVLGLEDPARPQLRWQQELGGTLTGLHVAGGRVWAELTRLEARPLELAPAGEAPRPPTGVAVSPTPPATTPAIAPPAGEVPTQVGVVLESRSGRLVIDLGSRIGLRRGDRVELFEERPVELGGGQSSPEEVRLAVGSVVAVSEERAQVALGLNERVPQGARARVTRSSLTEDRFAPPRVEGIWEIGFMARPFLPIGALGVGMVSSAQVGLRRTSPMHLQLLLEPAGLGFADEGNIIAMAGNLIGSYDTRVFEIGLGLGWSAVNEELTGSDTMKEPGGSSGFDASIDEVKSGLAIAQLARLGATDGLHLLVVNNFLLHDETFHYGGTVALGQVPVTTRSWLLLRGGLGTAGFGFGEIGLRWLARGNGDRGSLFLTVTAGGANLHGQKTETERYTDLNGQPVEYEVSRDFGYGGPMVGFGMEWRN